MRIETIRIVITYIDSPVFQKKLPDNAFISRLGEYMNFPSGNEDVLINIATETVIGTAFADNGLSIQVVIGQKGFLRQLQRTVHPYAVTAEKEGRSFKTCFIQRPRYHSKAALLR